MEWVEAVGKTVDDAVQEAMEALGASSREAVEIEVIEEAKKGVLGIGGREARVKVTLKPRKKKRRRGGGRGRRQQDAPNDKGSNAKSRKGKDGDRGQQQRKQSRPSQKKAKSSGEGEAAKKKVVVDKKPGDKPSIEEQAQVAREFAEGLLEAFGLDGQVDTRVEDDILFIDVNGEQTEALVGRKGAVIQAVHELTRTVIQRKTFGAPRMRLDIAGYAARRREALKIYAGRLAETVKEDGREAMLEPMNAADRKVVHDAIAEIDGVRSFSEGEEPNRSVVVAPND
jgi:spoIIIJ-associated protein